MSFQAYLDTIQKQTGKTAADLRSDAERRGWTVGGTLVPGLKAGTIVAALKDELGLGHGHAMAVFALLSGKRSEGD